MLGLPRFNSLLCSSVLAVLHRADDLSIIILCTQIGYSALPGIAFLALFSPVQTRVMKSLFAFRKKSMAWTDKRAKLLQELLGGMRIVKLMAWEVPFLDRLGEIRRNELRYIRSLLNYRSGMSESTSGKVPHN